MKTWLAVASLLLLARAARAHEFWIQPDRFTVAPHEPVAVQLRVGEGWPGTPRERRPDSILRLAWVDEAGERRLPGERGAEPVALAEAQRPGPAWLVYRSKPFSLTLPARRFEDYLVQEGLEAIVAERRRRGETAAPGRERYSRCAKSLLLVLGGDGGADAGIERSAWLRRPVGLTLEIIPRTDPRRLAGGGPFALQLLLEGRPLAGARVEALPKGGGKTLQARTDAQGRATFVLPAGGVWLLNTVQMQRAPAGGEADWQSVWSSLTFELPE